MGEREAVKKLMALARQWPETLWLFSASGTLNVMRKNSDGQKAVTPGGGIDQDYCIAEIPIENDGGDW